VINFKAHLLLVCSGASEENAAGMSLTTAANEQQEEEWKTELARVCVTLA